MLEYSSPELEKQVKDCLLYIEENEKEHGLNLDFFDINGDEFDPSEYDELIDENFMVNISPFDSDESLDLSILELIDLMNETKTAELKDGYKCITNKRCLIRVSSEDLTIHVLLDNMDEDTFQIESELNKINFTCSLVKGLTIFGIMVHFSNDFDKYLPSVLDDDLFVEITYNQRMSEEDIDKVLNAYKFELNSSHNLKININPRPIYWDYIDEDEVLKKKYMLRPLLFGRGMHELLKLFNEAGNGLYSYDYSVLQYTKVLEYVSQTVIRQEITNKALGKLMSSKVLNPDANFVKELEIMFSDFKNKYDTDRSAIKITVKTCCDILEITDDAPKHLGKIIDLKKTLSNDKVNKDAVLESAYDQLADSISDTRNFIAHAKVNYTLKGNECPDDQMGAFVKMLRILAIQTIKWFSLTSEISRIVP